MEISGPACNLRISDNPDNWDIKKEMDAINEPTPGWDKDIGKGIFMGKPIAYWIELDNHARELGIEDVALENAKLRKRITTLEKRQGEIKRIATRHWPFADPILYMSQVSKLIQEIEEKYPMTEITRKIK